MIWYAFEILLILAWVFCCFLMYRALVNSVKFTRFIERTKGTDEAAVEDIQVKLDVAEEQVDEALDYTRKKSDKYAELYGGLKKRRGS